jgi:hypothetical protein
LAVSGSGLLGRGPQYVDTSAEYSAVLDHDSRSHEVTFQRAGLADLNPFTGRDISFQTTQDRNATGFNVGSHISVWAHRETVFAQLDRPFDLAVNVNIFAAGDFAL